MKGFSNNNQSDIILENLLDAVIILDDEGLIMDANRAAETLFNKPASKLIGENFGYSVTPLEIQDIQIVTNKKASIVEMLATTIKWNNRDAYLMCLRDVTEKKKLEKELHSAHKQQKEYTKTLKTLNDTLTQSNESLQQFAHVASHDLKEPVRKIQVYVSRIKNDCHSVLNEVCKSYVDKIGTSATRMSSMIDAVLTYSGLSGAELPIEKIDLNEIVEEVQIDLEIFIQQKLAVIIHDGLPSIEGARILIYQLFYNLISNSLKFSKAGEHPIINIICKSNKKKSKKFVEIILKDNGIGFNQKVADKIFQSFTRLHSKEKFEGTGLGLSLCKKIVLRHDGTITAIGVENKGAEFYITLPIKQTEKII